MESRDDSNIQYKYRRWFIRGRDGSKNGPYTYQQMLDGYFNEHINKSTYVACTGMKMWTPLGELPLASDCEKYNQQKHFIENYEHKSSFKSFTKEFGRAFKFACIATPIIIIAITLSVNINDNSHSEPNENVNNTIENVNNTIENDSAQQYYVAESNQQVHADTAEKTDIVVNNDTESKSLDETINITSDERCNTGIIEQLDSTNIDYIDSLIEGINLSIKGEVKYVTYGEIISSGNVQSILPTEITLSIGDRNIDVTIPENEQLSLRKWAISNKIKENNCTIRIYGTFKKTFLSYTLKDITKVELLDDSNAIISTWYADDSIDKEYIKLDAKDMFFQSIDELMKYNSQLVEISGKIEDIQTYSYPSIFLYCNDEGYNSVGAEPNFVIYANVKDISNYKLNDIVTIRGRMQVYNYAVIITEE